MMRERAAAESSEGEGGGGDGGGGGRIDLATAKFQLRADLWQT